MAEITKQKLLEKIESALERGSQIESNKQKLNDDFVTRLTAQVVKNVQVRVSNVHIRFEDSVTDVEAPFVAGITFEQVVFETQSSSVVTTGQKYESKSPEDIIHKLVSLENFAIYWNVLDGPESVKSTFHSKSDHPDRDLIQFDCVATKERTPVNLNYLLKPITFNANATINRDPQLDNFKIPVFDLDLALNDFTIEMNRTQYESLLMLLDHIERYKVTKHHRKYRPCVPIIGNAKQWWKFAITAVIESEVKRRIKEWTWSCIKNHRETLKSYYEVYTELYFNPEDEDLIESATELEKNLDVFNIILVRRQVENEVASQFSRRSSRRSTSTAVPNTVDASNQGWIAWLWGSSVPAVPSPADLANAATAAEDGSEPMEGVEEKDDGIEVSDETPVLETFKKELTSEEKEKLFAAIGYCDNETATDFPPDFVAHLITMSINAIKFIISDGNKNLSEVSLINVLFSYKNRPSSNGFEVNSSVGELSIIGHDQRETLVREESKAARKVTKFSGLSLKDRVGSNSHPLHSANSSSSLYSNHSPGGIGDKSPLLGHLPGQAIPLGHSPSVGNHNGVQSSQSSPSLETSTTSAEGSPLFELTFEKRWKKNCVLNNLKIETRPVEIVYNQRLLDVIFKFFSARNFKNQKLINSVLSKSTKAQYEEFKKSTKVGIQNAVEELLEESENFDNQNHVPESKRSYKKSEITLTKWTFDLNLSAPQFIVPVTLSTENFLLIFDFGRLVFKNTGSTSITPPNSNTREMSEESDLFVTPPSTPSDEPSFLARKMAAEAKEKWNSGVVAKSLYQGYILEISDVQLLASREEDNWKFALFKGSGPLHVLNRFSLKLQLERRMTAFSAGLPRIILSGSLPQLSAFLDESKVSCLLKCFQHFIRDKEEDSVRPSGQASSPNGSPKHSPSPESSPSGPSVPNVNKATDEDLNTSLTDTSYVFFLAEFCIDNVSIAVQSWGENLVEAQIFAVQGKYEKSKHWFSVSFTVDSLLMVDAHQRLGKEFEILLASHKSLSMDSSRGTLEDSQKKLRSLSTLISSLPIKPLPNEALISLQYTRNDLEEKEDIAIIFNHFDAIANQETLIELVSFFKRVSAPTRTYRPDSESKNDDGTVKVKKVKKNRYERELKLDFRQLNVLLLKAQDKDVTIVSKGMDKKTLDFEKKLATATMSGASINCRFTEKAIVVEGSLDNLKIIDLINSLLYKSTPQVLKIGPDDILDNSFSGYKKSASGKKAISFTIRRSFPEDLLDVTFRTSSLYYKHSQKLLNELTSCASEFKEYMSLLATKIKEAAAEVAKDLVTSTSTTSSSAPGLTRFTSGAKVKLSSTSSGESVQRKVRSYIKEVRLQVHIDCPLIILPSSPSSLTSIVSLFQEQPKRTSSSGKEVILTPAHPADRLNIITVGLEVKDGQLRFVDDFKPIEVPLVEMHVSELYLWHKVRGHSVRGNLKAVLSSDYYNRSKAGWEPLIEPWKFTLDWEMQLEKWTKDGIIQKVNQESRTKKSIFRFISDETLNLNLTSTSLDLYRLIRKKWTENEDVDYFGNQLMLTDGKSRKENEPNIPSFSPINPRELVDPKLPTNAVPTIENKIILDVHGIGLSVINKYNEELIYVTLRTVIFEYIKTDSKHSVNCSVRDIQVDNQLKEAFRDVAIYPVQLEPSDPMNGQPALSVSLQKLIVPHVHFFPEIQVRLKDVVINIEELLLLKLYEFFGYPWPENVPVPSFTSRAIRSALGSTVSFIYLTLLEIALKQIHLSVHSAIRLPRELQRLKEKLGLVFISFEDARIQLQPFKRVSSLETWDYLRGDIVRHYKQQLHKSAAKILGTVDFLGNPLGLMSDINDGVNRLIEGNVGGLVTNITHGISNSTAKFMSSLSNGIEAATVDHKHQEMRRRIKQENTGNFRTGLKGLGVGIMGGVTSIVTQTFEGAVSDGLEGLVSGFGKGLIGTVTKPTVGMLDFATGAASAVRETVRKISHHSYATRVRPPRVGEGPGGLIPPYDLDQAEGQQYLYRSSSITDKEEDEKFLLFRLIQSDIACLLTSHRVRILNWNTSSSSHGKLILSAHFDDLIKCNSETRRLPTGQMASYLVIEAYEQVLSDDVLMSTDFPSFGPNGDLSLQERVKRRGKNCLNCTNDRIATEMSQSINLAKGSYDKKIQLANEYVMI